jgi:sugar phosphate isomerase/epimerase
MTGRSLNQATIKRAGLAEAVRVCADTGFEGIGLWRDRVAEVGPTAAARLVAAAGLATTSLCRGGFFTSTDPDERAIALADNRAAIDETAELGAAALILVAGGLPETSQDLGAARQSVRYALAELAPYAQSRGVRLAIEPLHPMFCADRAVVSTLGQALDLAEPFPPEVVGVCVDSYHVWWDPDLDRQLARARGRIASLQLADWALPLCADPLLSRGHLGTGTIQLAHLTATAFGAGGYSGPVEVEIFRQDVWDAPAVDTARQVHKSLTEILRQARSPVTVR